MDKKLETQVEKVIRKLVNDCKRFTAYDVTRILRANNIECHHSEVRSIVHNLFSNQEMCSEYSRGSVHINGANPFVYHHYMDDPSRYDPDALNPDDDADIVNDNSDDGDKVVVYEDYRGRLYVGPGLVRQLDVQNGDKVYVYSDTDKELVISDYSPGWTAFKEYTVDKDDAVRIGPSVLRAAGLKGCGFHALFSGGASGRYITITNIVN